MLALRRTALSSRAFSTSARQNLAKISLIGHLGDTPELQATSTGHEIVRYAVATNSGPKDNRHTSWFRVTAFVEEGPRRDFLLSLAKGSMVYVEGEARNSTYDDEGKTRTSFSVLQQNIEVLKRPEGSAPAAAA